MNKTESSPRQLLILASSIAVVTGYDMSSIIISAVSIRGNLGFSAQTSPWIMSGFTLTFGGFLLLGGRLGDIYGRRRIILSGTSLFVFASLLGACAPNSGCFLLSRAFKGIGAALMMPNALALINTSFAEGKERHKAFGIFGFFAEIGYAGGNFLGGILTSYSWRAALALSAAIGLVILIEAAQVRPPRDKDANGKHRFDLLGAVLSVAAFGALLLAITDAVERGIASSQTIVEGGVSVGCFAVFFWRISHFHSPLLPPVLLRNRNVIGASVLMFLFMACDQGTVFQVVSFLQEVLKYSPGRTGVAFAPLILITLTSAFCTNRLLDSLGFKRTIALGLIVRSLALLALITFGADTTYVRGFLPIMIFISLSFPMTLISLHIPAGLGVAKEMQGIAYGTSYALEQIGMSFGLNILSAIALTATHAHGGSNADSLVYGFRMSTIVSTCISVVTLVIGLVVLKVPMRTGQPEVSTSGPIPAVGLSARVDS